MIKFMAEGENGRKMLGLGLSLDNCDRLAAGFPIHIHAEELLSPEINVKEILIFYGETEEEMTADFHKAGFLKNAKIHREGGSH